MDAIKIREIVDQAINQNTTIRKHSTDISDLKQGVRELKQDVRGLKTEQHRQGIVLEEIQTQVQTIAEAVTSLLKQSEERPIVFSTLESHRQDIAMTQRSLKNHVTDPNAHKE